MCKSIHSFYTRCGCVIKTGEPCKNRPCEETRPFDTSIDGICDNCQGLNIKAEPELPPLTETKTHRIKDSKTGDETDITVRSTQFTEDQRDALAGIGLPRINKIDAITSCRPITVNRTTLSREQRAALRAAGHTNLRRITTVASRRAPEHDSASGTTRHTFSVAQRTALIAAGHTNLRTLVVKDRRP